MGGGEAGSCFSMPDSIAIQVLLCLLLVLLTLFPLLLVASFLVVNVAVDALVNHLM